MAHSAAEVEAETKKVDPEWAGIESLLNDSADDQAANTDAAVDGRVVGSDSKVSQIIDCQAIASAEAPREQAQTFMINTSTQQKSDPVSVEESKEIS
eukprot:CAMPEP_0170451806 /NCGR_PEP_ID=MMETSP0123-20130129/933_1 /TAXON_ID=182087 /ORGANISM="Favella ehrenbergii, Strain Fehren 1" /LENGTH=96 /DNA_ID=CAMNT_0010713637 /DNA_START=204 /DNA_END=494 /DNA_ORIENTATION=-